MSNHPSPEVRLRYTALGGVGGWSTQFETDSSKLTDAEEQELRRLITEADFFNVEAVQDVEPTTVIVDGFTVRLWIALDRRNREVVRGDGFDVEDSDAFRALLAWAADQAPPLFGRGDVDL